MGAEREPQSAVCQRLLVQHVVDEERHVAGCQGRDVRELGGFVVAVGTTAAQQFERRDHARERRAQFVHRRRQLLVAPPQGPLQPGELRGLGRMPPPACRPAGDHGRRQRHHRGRRRSREPRGRTDPEQRYRRHGRRERGPGYAA
jgi:hypothetical protein